MLVVVCPGQGAQSPGMLAPWLELPSVAESIARASRTTGLDLVAHGTTSDADTIRDTAVAQPLLVATALASLRAVLDLGADDALDVAAQRVVGATAGHSVGELAAAAIAGVLTDDEALRLVTVRGAAMARAAASTPTGMCAVLGGDPDEVLAALAEHGLVPANVNGGGQVVAAGTLDALAAFAAAPPARARVIAAAGGGRVPHRAHGARGRRAARRGRRRHPRRADGPAADQLRRHASTASGARALELIVAQVANPVRWDLCQATLLDARRHRAARGRPRRGAHRAGPAYAARGRDGRRQDPRRPRRRTRPRPSAHRNPREPPGELVVTRPTLTQATGPAHTRILGLGGVRGERVVPNDELVGPIDSSDEWIRQRTGIITRRRAEAGTDVLDLAEGAAQAALENAGLTGADIDVVILSTVTYFHQTPAGAAIIADRIGATPAAAFDISAACAGYCYGIGQADALVRAGTARNVLVIGAEKMSELRRPDRPVDLVPAGRRRRARSSSARPTRPASARPSGAPTAARRRRSGRRTPGSRRATRALGWPTLRQEGQSVYKWAVWQMAPVAQKAMDAAGVTADEIEAFIPHQANMRIIDQMIKTLEASRTRSSSAATSRTPATRRPRRSRWRPSGCCARVR